MLRVVRWFGSILFVLLLLAAGLVAVSRLIGPDDAQRAALELLQPDDAAPPGSNAFAALWLIEFDVPSDEIEALAGADVAQFERALADRGPYESLEPVTLAAEDRYPRFLKAADDLPQCHPRDVACLEQVRANPAAYATQLARQQDLVARVRALADFDVYRNPMPADLRIPFPPLQHLAVSRTASALDFIEGRTDEALEAACRDVAAWRRFGAQADSLLVAMVAHGTIDAGARLVAEMLAELPLDQPLPEMCTRAFDPAAVTPNLCPAMRGEAQLSKAAIEAAGNQAGLINRWVLLDGPGTLAIMAPTYAHACRPEVRQSLLDDTPIDAPAVPTSLWRLQCAGNLVGCVLADVGRPGYASYLQRVQDSQAVIRTLDALLRLRVKAAANGVSPLSVATSEGIPSVGRPIRVDAAALDAGIELRGAGEGAHWRVPLPGSRLQNLARAD
ncbi:hypothetical protein OS176_06840 [Xanthomonadaceae bacterium XH05]|nr:hypothetical protein [Xanthomonadaceae bacterium XH05]